MKCILLTIVMLVALPALILCQTNGKNTDKKGGDEQAVRQVINDLATALGRNDVAALDRIYADDYIFVGDNGMMMTKAERLAAFKSGDLKYESISIDIASLRLFGDLAVAVTRITSKFAPNSKYTDGKFVTTATLAKLKGRWQLVAASNVRVVER